MFILQEKTDITQAADQLPDNMTVKTILVPRIPTATPPGSGYFRDVHHIYFPSNHITFS